MSPKPHHGLDEQKAIVRVFLERCRHWAQHNEIPKRTRTIAQTPSAPEAAKLHAWIAYDQFLDHTLQELADGTLDHWFLDGVPEYNKPEGETR